MINLPLQPLIWARIDTKKLSGIYCQKTDSYIEDAVSFCSTPVAEYVIRKDKETGKYSANYGGRNENPYDTLDEAEHWAEHTHYASKMQPYVKPDSITDIANWFKAAKPEPTIEDLCVQIGCCLEEVAELIESLGGVGLFAHDGITFLADKFKEKDESAISRITNLTYEQRIAITDACCDINVTSVGVMQLLGGVDVLGAQREVVRSNNSKMVDGKFIFNDNGKIKKPESYSEPDLKPFISTMQNLHKGEWS